MGNPGAQGAGNDCKDKVVLLSPVQAQLLEKTPFVGFLGIDSDTDIQAAGQDG